MMSLNTWLRNVEGRHWEWLGRFPRFQTGRRPVQPVRLQLEWLEARMLLSPGPGILGWPLPIPPFLLVDTWINPNGGNWDKPQNWSFGVPKPYDAVLIPYSGITIIHNWAVADSFQSLTLPASTTLLITAGSLTGNTFTNSGNFILGIGTSAYLGTLNSTGTVDAQSGVLTVADFIQAGAFILETGASAAITNSLNNTGTVSIRTGCILDAVNYSQAVGATVLSNGTLISQNSIWINGGTLSGPGSINGNLVNAGEISPGAPGILAINGNYSQTATGSLDIGLAGTTPGVQFDQVLISGIASLGGVLNVNFLNNFTPSPGQSFQVMKFASSSGAFAAINGLNAANGTTLIAQYNPQDLTLLVRPIVPINPPPKPLPNPLPILPNPIPVPPNLPTVPIQLPLLSSPIPASQPAINNASTGTTFLPRNYQADSGFSTPNQIYYYSGGSQVYTASGGSSESLLPSKHSEDVAFSGGSGDDDQETMLDFPVQLNMTSDDEAFSTSDIAAALLVGVRPKLVPQKNSQVAPVATLLTDDSGEEMRTITASEEENPLKDSLINPLSQMQIGSFQSSLQMRLGEDLTAKGFDNLDETPSPKTLFNLSPLAVLAGALVALWGIQKYRNGKVKPTQPGLET